MKNTLSLGVAVLATALMTGSFSADAQRKDSVAMSQHHGQRFGHDRGRPQKSFSYGIPDLTSDQQKKIEALNLSMRKETLPLTNVLAEKKAHLHTLQTADKSDLKAINATIDEMTQLSSQLLKKRAANHDAIRNLLTDQQRVAFDSHKGGRGGFHHRPDKHS